MVLEHEVLPRGRVGSSSVVGTKRRKRFRRPSDRASSAAPSSPPPPPCAARSRSATAARESEHDEREQRERHRLRLPHSAAPARRSRDQERAGEREQRVPADVLPDVVAREMAELVRDHDLQLPVGEPPVEERVPQHDAAARAEAGRLRVRQRRHVAHGLDDDRRVLHVLDPLERARLTQQHRIPQRVRAEQIRRHERGQRRQRDEDRRRRQPPPVAQPAREPHHDREREAEEDELAAEREPVPEDVREVADVRQVMASLPPQRGHVEGQLRQPEQREAEHPEQHPRPDRPGCRLPREAHAPAGVHDEDDQLDHHRHRPRSCREPSVRRRRVQLRRGEIAVDRDMRKMERRRHARLPEQVRRHGPHRRERHEQRSARDGPAAHPGG